jgi:hypothetical protein
VNEAKRIEPRQLHELLELGPITVLDMRGDWSQSERKIPGAVRVDPARYQDYLSSLPQGRPVVTYCT